MHNRFSVRIDNRLLHGQVVQFWIPHLGIEHLIVADDGVGTNVSMKAIYRMALPRIVELTILPVDSIAATLSTDIKVPTLLLIKDIANLEKILDQGFSLRQVTIGNVHASPERKRVTDAVYLSEAEVGALVAMQKSGMIIEIQTFPGEVLRFVSPEKGGPRWGK
jgi:mannose/fructose/N-acetylgalactosamine-specific phosphotransferase system component IIB